MRRKREKRKLVLCKFSSFGRSGSDAGEAPRASTPKIKLLRRCPTDKHPDGWRYDLEEFERGCIQNKQRGRTAGPRGQHAAVGLRKPAQGARGASGRSADVGRTKRSAVPAASVETGFGNHLAAGAASLPELRRCAP